MASKSVRYRRRIAKLEDQLETLRRDAVHRAIRDACPGVDLETVIFLKDIAQTSAFFDEDGELEYHKIAQFVAPFIERRTP